MVRVLASRRLIRYFDAPLLAAAVAACVVGVFLVLSATHDSPVLASLSRKQVLWVCLGMGALLVCACFDFQWLDRLAGWIYWGQALLLLFVVIRGAASAGARRWIALGPFTLQPSELAKLGIIVTLSILLSRRIDHIRHPEVLGRSLVHVGLPAALVFLQPDLGTALVFAAIWLGMMWAAGAPVSHLFIVLAVGVTLFAAAWRCDLIRPYQKARMTSFLDPEADIMGSGYHISQSQIAVGAGGLWGAGLFHGTQNRLDFIPAQHTDFIFTIAAEEFGFVGSVFLLAAYLLLIWRAWRIAESCESPAGMLMAAGIASMFTFHVVVNVGMCIRLAPVTGLPLPFVSYGGSSMVVSLAAVGLLESIAMRRHRIIV